MRIFIGFYISIGNWKRCVGPGHKDDVVKQWVHQNESRDEINRIWIECYTEKKRWSKGEKCVSEDVEKMEPLSIVHGSVKSCSFYDKQNGSFSKLKNITTMWSSNSTSAYLTKIIEIWRDICPPMSTTSSTIGKICINSLRNLVLCLEYICKSFKWGL